MKYTSIIFVTWSMNQERGELAKQSFLSLIESIDSPAEIIVIDNGNDETISSFFLTECQNRKISHYIRNADNWSFGFARNQGLTLAAGDYIAIVDNDILYEKGWLEKCVDFLENSDGKYLATPISYPLTERYNVGYIEYKGERWKKDMRAGSNCWVMKRKDYETIGNFKLHRIAGSLWTDCAVGLGYVFVVTPQDMVRDVGLRRGYNLKEALKIEKTLLNGEKIKIL